MKNTSIYFVLIPIFFWGLFSFFSSSSTSIRTVNSIDLNRLKHKHIDDLNELIEDLNILKTYSIDSSNKETIDFFLKTKTKFKSSELIIAYFSYDELKYFINSAPLPRLENHVPEVVVLNPHGFQVIEELIYSNDNKKEIINEINTLQDHFEAVINYHSNLNFEHRHLFEITRQGIIRLVSLGITGFDTPCSDKAIIESSSSFSSLHKLMYIYIDAYKFCPEAKELNNLFIKGYNYLTDNSDFDTFNRYFFLKNYALPIYSKVLDFQKCIGIETIDETTSQEMPTNYQANSFFSPEFFNTTYYTQYDESYQNKSVQKLGKLLFFDPILSKNNIQACASCHRPELAFTDGLKKSIASDLNRSVERNAPTVIDAIINDRYFYDLRSKKIERQIAHVVVSSKEFHMSFYDIAKKLSQSKEYKKLFKIAYPKFSNNIINSFTISTALGAYVSTLTSYNSKFDQSLLADAPDLNEDQIRGFNLFMGKAACATCHFPPTFNGLVPPYFNENESEVIGVPSDTNNQHIDPDPGRYNNGKMNEKSEIYLHSFKTSTVRNIELTAPYMHNGVYKNLEQVIDFYNNGGGIGIGLDVPNQTLPQDSLHLSSKEKNQIIAFMRSLTDTTDLTNKPKSLPKFDDIELNKRKIGGNY
ncbi:MAG: cytochrome-c peroxidase [Parvicellaceae bacterium]